MLNECRYFDRELALHTAPALLGIKPACLVSMDSGKSEIKDDIEKFNKKASVKGLEIKVLCSCGNRTLLFLYSSRLLSTHISVEETIKVLEKFGYKRNFSLDEHLERLSERIEKSHEFPHEISVFLGYPIKDVLGFIENKGKNYLFCGFWKVYSNPEKASRTFDNYGKCRKFLCNKLNQCNDIYQALKIS